MTTCQLSLTITYDQRSEMALHETLSADLNMDILFCDPHSPWQRGSNENANGLVREFLLKGMAPGKGKTHRAYLWAYAAGANPQGP